MTGLGYRREMADWDMSAVDADFFEVAPENWMRRDRAPLHALRASGRAVHLHGVTLNLGGQSAPDTAYLAALRSLLDAENFRSGVERVVRMAGDADTNGAVAGALLGSRFGASAIPRSWLEVLLRKDDLLSPLKLAE